MKDGIETINMREEFINPRTLEPEENRKVDELRQTVSGLASLGNADQTEILDTAGESLLDASREYVIKDVFVYNPESSVTTYIFYDSTDDTKPVFRASVAATTQANFRFDKGWPFGTTVEVKASQWSTGTHTVDVSGVMRAK